MIDDAASRDVAADSDYQPTGGPVTGRRFLLIVLGFFGVIIAANVTMMSFALGTFGGLVVPNAYVAGLHFNSDVADAETSVSATWTVEATPSPIGLSMTIQDAAGAPVSSAAISGVVGRPSHDREDTAVTFVELSPGVYTADAALNPGAWRLVVRLLPAGETTPVAKRYDLYLSTRQ